METGLAAPILDRQKDVDTDNLIGFIQKPPGMPDGVFRKLVSAEVHKPGGVIDVGTIQAAVDKAASEWVSTHRREADMAELVLTSAAAQAAGQKSTLSEFVSEHVIRDIFDDAVDAIADLAGFKCNAKDRAAIRQAIREVKQDMKATFPGDKKAQMAVGTTVVAGGAALADRDPKQIPGSIKVVNDAVKEVTADPQQKLELQAAADQGGAKAAAEYVHDHSAKLRDHLQRHHMTREGFITKIEQAEHRKGLQHSLDPDAKDSAQRLTPAQPHNRQYRAQLTPDLPSDTMAKPTVAATVKTAPTQKFTGLTV